MPSRSDHIKLQDNRDLELIDQLKHDFLLSLAPSPDIAVLLDRISTIEDEHKTELDELKSEHESTLSELDTRHEAHAKILRDELHNNEDELTQLETTAKNLQKTAERFEARAAKYKKRSDWLETIARKQAEILEQLGRGPHVKVFSGAVAQFDKNHNLPELSQP